MCVTNLNGQPIHPMFLFLEYSFFQPGCPGLPYEERTPYLPWKGLRKPRVSKHERSRNYAERFDKNYFFSSNERGHYRTAHYLCERDNCRHGLELYFTRDELNLHIQEVHANPICPVAAPVVKVIDLNYTYNI